MSENAYWGDALCWRDKGAWHMRSTEYPLEYAAPSYAAAYDGLRRMLGTHNHIDEGSVYLMTYQRHGAGIWVGQMLICLGRNAGWCFAGWLLKELIVHLAHRCPPLP